VIEKYQDILTAIAG
jgi:hypothetical protein